MDTLTQDFLQSILSYDKQTGAFVWIVSPAKNVFVGSVAGNISNIGYRVIKIKGKSYKAHRLAWLYEYGKFPIQQIDHINGNRSDNSIVNLRLASQTQNSQNKIRKPKNKSGYKGVSVERNGKFRAHIRVNRKLVSLGTHETAKEAHAAYCNAARELFGEYARFN